MTHRYLKHDETQHHTFFKHLKQRKHSARLLLFGFLLTFIALIVNIVVRSSYRPSVLIGAAPAQGAPAQEVKGIAIQDVLPAQDTQNAQDVQPTVVPPTPTPTRKPSKSYYTIAVIGDSDNRGSIGLHTALGFAPVGVVHACGWKFERWLDIVMMECAIGSGSDTAPAQ